MRNIMNDLHTIGLNPFAVTLLAESLLKSPLAPMTVGKPQGFFFPVQRGDCPGWSGVRITLEAVPVEQTGEVAPAQPSSPIAGADLAFFTKLRAIIIDETQEPRNRLATIDCLIAELSGAPQPPSTAQHKPLHEQAERLTPSEAICAQARKLTEIAAALDLVLTIERRPLQPLAMGHAEYAIETRPARGSA